MYDIKLLEKKWEEYNRKKRKPFYLYSTFLLIFVAIAVMAFLNKEFILSKLENYNSSTTENTAAVTSPVVLDAALNTLALKSIHTTSKNHIKESGSRSRLSRDNNPMDPSDVFIELTDAGDTSAEETLVRKKPKMKLDIEVTEISYSAYKAVEERFSEAPDSDDSLFLARGYYERKKYSKAAYWALQTNKLDGDIEESWLIFARSKAKIGHKNEALRVLSEYVKKSNSSNARKLLNELKR